MPEAVLSMPQRAAAAQRFIVVTILVSIARREEFKEFAWQGEVPDPQSEETFRASILDRSGGSAELGLLYRELLRLRATIPTLRPRRGE